MNNVTVKYLKDYQVPDFLIENTNLFFEILTNKIVVNAKLHITKNKDSKAKDITLDGEELTTLSLKIDGKLLKEGTDYVINKNNLVVFSVKDKFILETTVEIDPFNNTKLMGIYKSSSCICSQCEPEGFRRITWFLDRPDVMSVFKVSITAEEADYKTLLSNGNLISSEVLGSKRTSVFVDPYPKPSYLFAFVAGNFDSVSRVFKTKSGKEVQLNTFVEVGKKDQAMFSLISLEKAMRWDEETFNLEYDLNVFSIVAVSDFNFGAMENKSLNIFNEVYVLADHKIATDDDYYNIESIVAHEYFHNFTGDRITCRDWFQLTLKEGLTVFRDQKFSEDLHNKGVVRISDVERLRNFQFSEDASPLAHPIRPTSYMEMNNFYTATVYEKGAEVIRMIETIIGEEKFKKGIDLYFENFDGKAVTCDDFVWAMEKASGVSLEKFKRWYEQSGTPLVNVQSVYNQTNKTFSVTFSQVNNPTFDQKEKQNLVLPIKVALLAEDGKFIDLIINKKNLGKEYVVILENNSIEVVFEDVAKQPTLSGNRFFSAPVVFQNLQSDEDKINIMLNDTDGVNRFEASQSYLKKYMINAINNMEQGLEFNVAEIAKILLPYEKLLLKYKQDVSMVNLLLKIPSNFEVHYKQNFPVENVVKVIKIFEEQMAKAFEKHFFSIFNNLVDKEDEFSAEMMAIRALKNRALYYLLKTQKQDYLDLAVKYYKNTESMTKKIGVLISLKDLNETKEYKLVMEDFYNKYKNYNTVLNKWFAIKAGTSIENALNIVKELLQLETFSYKNPNKVRALIGGFMGNSVAFHKLDGSGYLFIKETILLMDKINPSISAGLAKGFAKVNIHKKDRQKLMREALEKVLNTSNISKGLYEVVSKILEVSH